MSKLQELTKEEIFEVLLCGNQPKDGYTIKDYIKEWNERVAKGAAFQVNVPSVNK